MSPFKAWPRPFQYFRDAKVFLITLSVIISFLMAIIFTLRYDSVKRLMIQSMKDQAVSYTNQIVLTRHWNAEHGGVYVEKKPGVESNVFLRQVGVEPDIRTVDGRTLTLRNPAAMTRELSELTLKEKGVRFHMISLKYLNPENRPDAFEQKALKEFERGIKDIWWIDRTGSAPLFRYVMPLLVEEPCLLCHAMQGYKVGDVRGGISISIPTESMDGQLRKNRIEIIVVAVIFIGLLVGILYFMTWKLVARLDEAQKQLKHMAVTDELTGLKNRRYIMEQLEREYQRSVRSGEPLSLILLDIDHFKRINDTHGHGFGDLVLKSVADAMQSSLRSYDLLGRIGGEEFLIASPGSSLDEAAGLAQRILEKIKRRKIGDNGHEVAVTISAGVTSLGNQDARAETLLGRADTALYMAKQEGRDRLVIL
jgi:diguanylate cyclase (GGDEF)-like protein